MVLFSTMFKAFLRGQSFHYKNHSLKNGGDLANFLNGTISAIFQLTKNGDFDTLTSSLTDR